ncbi:2-hydroxy-6-oxononadienedioate/2-hydroxy-6-oxononatrienedioate hydrolase [compost metagenome]
MFRKQISNNDKDTRLIKLMLDEPNISPKQLDDITQKVLIVAGSEDVILEEHTRSIAAMIKNSQLRILPNASHYLPFEQPEELNRMVLEFLREK